MYFMDNFYKTGIEEKVKRLIGDKLDLVPGHLKGTDSLFDDMGADSLDALEIRMDIETYYKVSVPDSAFEEWKTIDDIVEYLDSVLNPVGI